MLKKTLVAAAFGLSVGLAAAAPVGAVTFATYNPTTPAVNVSLTGLTLSASAPVVFNYLTPALSALGSLAATLSLTATETGAIAFGPVTLATFDGSFSLTYTGPTKTVGGITAHTGDDLLSGVFLGSVFSGYGSTASIIDSITGGGLVSYSDNSFVTFDPLADEGLVIGMTEVTPPTAVVGGKLTDFRAVSQGQFAADLLTGGGGGTPEPATWAMMLVGFGAIGLAARRRAKFAGA